MTTPIKFDPSLLALVATEEVTRHLDAWLASLAEASQRDIITAADHETSLQREVGRLTRAYEMRETIAAARAQVLASG